MEPKQLGVDIELHPGTDMISMITDFYPYLLGLTTAIAVLSIAIYAIKAITFPGSAAEKLHHAIAGTSRTLMIVLILSSIGTFVGWICSVGPLSTYINAATQGL